MITLETVSKRYRDASGHETSAVDAVSLEIGEGESLCLLGTSGCGKTTTLKLINRLVEPTSGRILVAGQDTRQIDPVKLRRGMGYVIQAGGLFPHMTVAENIGLLGRLEGWQAARLRDRIEALLALVNLEPDMAPRFPQQLSGGQRQRVGVARALLLDPPIVLMDEPFGALDPITREQIHEEFLALRRRVRKTVVMVTHDLAEAFKLGDRIALMDAGRLVQLDTPEGLRARPATAFVEAFLGNHLGKPAGAPLDG